MTALARHRPLVLAVLLSLAAAVPARADQPLAPVEGGGLVISALPVQPLEGGPLEGGEVIEASPAAPVQLAALPVLPDAPRRAGLPEPSIIVGDLAVLTTMAERGPLGTPRPAREAIRQRDSAIFERLLSQGAFDPDADQLAAALQTELAQMNCYGGGIDGDWGAGSAAALGRYFQTLGAAQAATAPDTGLFRTIARNEAVRCADVQTAAPARAAPAASRSGSGGGGATRATGGGGTAPAAARAQPQAQPAQPTDTGPRRINPGLIGSGVFR